MKEWRMKIGIGVILSLGSMSWGGSIETWHLFLAQYYTQQQQYSKARYQYEKIEDQSDTVHYNLGNLFYREKHYTEAISQYMQIQTPALMHQRYHNIGNCLMALGEIASAARFYRNALKFAKHPATLSISNSPKHASNKKQKRQKRGHAKSPMKHANFVTVAISSIATRKTMVPLTSKMPRLPRLSSKRSTPSALCR